MERNSNAAAVAWIALIAAILALILAWVAYNRTGADLEEQIQAAVEDAVEEIPDIDVRGGDIDLPEVDVDTKDSSTSGTTTETQ